MRGSHLRAPGPEKAHGGGDITGPSRSATCRQGSGSPALPTFVSPHAAPPTPMDGCAGLRSIAGQMARLSNSAGLGPPLDAIPPKMTSPTMREYDTGIRHACIRHALHPHRFATNRRNIKRDQAVSNPLSPGQSRIVACPLMSLVRGDTSRRSLGRRTSRLRRRSCRPTSYLPCRQAA